MFAWIPLVGPFIQAVVDVVKHTQDTNVQKAQIASTERIADGQQTVEVLKTRAAVATVFSQDLGVRFARNWILNWAALYYSLIFYDSCFRNLLPSYMTWRILAVPASLEYLMAAIVAFLFVTAWKGK